MSICSKETKFRKLDTVEATNKAMKDVLNDQRKVYDMKHKK